MTYAILLHIDMLLSDVELIKASSYLCIMHTKKMYNVHLFKCELVKKVVKKVNPETSCQKMPREICAPGNCVVRPSEKVCLFDQN